MAHVNKMAPSLALHLPFIRLDFPFSIPIIHALNVRSRCERVEARDATAAELASVHTEEHVANMCSVSNKKLAKSKRAELARRRSVYFNEGSSSAALLAAGSVVEVSI